MNSDASERFYSALSGTLHEGYILGSGCVVPRNTRKENLLALSIAAKRFGTVMT
jgi:hypothetical protein